MRQSEFIREGLEDYGVNLHCIGINKTGEPLHPCYSKKDLKPLPY